MLDRREQILARLLVVLGAVDGIKNIYRNQTDVSATQRPAIVVLDADEDGAIGEFTLGRPANTPNVMHMQPQIVLMAGGPASAVGAILNGFRLAIINAVLNDPQIAIAVGSNGGVQYQGCVTDLGQGRTMEGLMILTFSFHYPLLNQELS